MSSLVRLKLQQKKSHFEFILHFLSYFFGIETTNTLIHNRSSFVNHTRFQTKTAQKPHSLGVADYGLHKGVSPGHVPIMFPHLFVSLSFDIIGGTLVLIAVSILYKTTKIVRALWLAERSVRMRVSVNTVVASRCFAFRALITQARIWRRFPVPNSTILFYLPIPSSVEIFTNKPCQFFFAQADILSDKNPYFGKHLFAK